MGVFSTANFRQKSYAALVAAFFCLSVCMGIGKAIVLNQEFNLIVSDGRFYYAYLPSLVIDRDLDFSNQISEHWDVDFSPTLLDNQTSTGLIHNQYPIGVALTLLPAFFLGHTLALLSGGLFALDGYSLPYQLACLAMIEGLVWCTLVSVDKILTAQLHVPAAPTFLALLVIAIGTPYTYYILREPLMAHAVSTYWCTIAAFIATQGGKRGPAWLLPRLAFVGAMAVICRPTNIHLLPLGIWGLIQAIQESNVRSTIKSFPLVATAGIPIVLQMLTWHTLSGKWQQL